VPATDSPGPSAADLDAVRGNSPINPGASPTSPDADLARGLAALRAGEVSQGVQWLEQACEQGDSLEACFELARAYRLGKGVTPDPERAQSLLEQACAGGLREACDSLGH